jgi:RNA polymerase sigma-70 factor (ECF subfamily)
MRVSHALHGVDGPLRDVVDRSEQSGGATGAMAQATVTAEVTECEGAMHAPPFGLPTPPAALTFDDLVDRHQAEIYRFAMQLTRNRADADDLYQETLIKAYRAFDRLDGAANHRAWLYKIATNTFLSSQRKAGREGPLDETAELNLPAEATDHAASLDARALLQEVEAFVANLPAKQRVALILRKYHEAGYDEIAANLKCSEAAARANVHEALRKLRECFGDRL